jgi:hypothetical protein
MKISFRLSHPRFGLLLALVLFASVGLSACSQALNVEEKDEGIVVYAPSFSERVDLAIHRAPRAVVLDDVQKQIKQIGGKILVDAPDRVRGWPDGTDVRPLLGDPTVRALLEGTDDMAAAKAIWDSGVRVVAVHWRIAPGVDRDKQVISRLYHHGELGRFSLVRITQELLIYEVIDQPVYFPPSLAARCIQAIRADIEGQPPPPELANIGLKNGEWEFMASIRGQGRELAIGLTHNRLLGAALKELADDLERGHRRYAEYYGFPPLKEHIKDLSIEIHRISEKAIVDVRDEGPLEQLWELGLDGAIIRDFKAKDAAMFPGSVAYTRSITTTDSFLRNAADFGRLDQKRPWRDPEIRLEMVRDIHYREVPGKGIQFLYRGVPVESLASVNLENIKKAILGCGEWYLTNLKPNGMVTYKWWPSENRESDEYNHVRHALATWNLTFAYRLDPRPEFLEGAQRAQDWTNTSLRFEEDRAFYSYGDNQKLGSVVVALLGMIDLARLKDDHSNDDLMRKLGNFVKFMQEPSGKFKGYYVSEDHPYADFENDIVPGEAALSLVYLANYFDDKSWIEPLKKYWAYYVPWFRERAKKTVDGAPWPAYTYENDTRLELVQFGPWTVMAANAYNEATGDPEVATFGLEVAKWMIDTYEWTSERAPFPDYVGGYYKLPHELPAMQAFCYGEGTAAAYNLALRAAPDQVPFFEKATRETVRFAFEMQYDDGSVYPFSRPWFVKGGIRYALNETKVRVDYVHHGMSAMFQYYQGALKDPNLPEEVKAPAVPLSTDVIPFESLNTPVVVAPKADSAPMAHP